MTLWTLLRTLGICMQALNLLALPLDTIKCILLRAVQRVSPIRVARVMSVCSSFRDLLHNVSATHPTTARPNSFDRLRIRDCAALRTLHISADRTVPLLHGPEDSERAVFDKARKAETQLTALKSIDMDSQPAELGYVVSHHLGGTWPRNRYAICEQLSIMRNASVTCRHHAR